MKVSEYLEYIQSEEYKVEQEAKRVFCQNPFCGVEIDFTERREPLWFWPNGADEDKIRVCSGCHYDALSEVIERHPIVTPGIRRG